MPHQRRGLHSGDYCECGTPLGQENESLIERSLPFNFGQQPINHVDDYVSAYHTRRYIAHLGRECRISIHELARRFERRNLCKLYRRRAEWNCFLGPIPPLYLGLIKCNLDVLCAAMEVDQKEYETALTLTTHPRSMAVHWIPAVFSEVEFPERTTEAEGIRLAQEFLVEHPHQWCMITWPGLKTIYINPGRPPYCVYRRPRLFCNSHGHLSLGYNGSLVGITRIG